MKFQVDTVHKVKVIIAETVYLEKVYEIRNVSELEAIRQAEGMAERQLQKTMQSTPMPDSWKRRLPKRKVFFTYSNIEE